jgi:hypothetical protein
MKVSNWLLLTAIISGFYSSAYPQVLVLNGAITDASGIYADSISQGDPLELTLDFTRAYTYGEIFKGHTVGEADYAIFIKLTVAGGNLLPEDNSIIVSLRNNLPLEGLFIGNGWNDANVGHDIFQSLLSPNDILPAKNIFPADIPMDAFTNTNGSFMTTNSTGLVTLGRIDWDITSYTGSVPEIVEPPPPFYPVPEASAYGVAGSVGLIALAIRRVRKAGKLVQAC